MHTQARGLVTLCYFAYGSNMSWQRLSRRTPSARIVGPASLNGHQLRFHKIGRDGSGKCDIVATDAESARVFGVLFQIDAGEIPALDAAEDLGTGYRRRALSVTDAGHRRVEAFAYTALITDRNLRPFTWYLEHVLNGAREHALPDAYIAMIAATPATDDPDRDRHHAEMSIYRS